MAIPRAKKLTDATYSPTIAASEEAIRSQVDGAIQEVFDLGEANFTAKTGDHLGTWRGLTPTQVEPGLSATVEAHLAESALYFGVSKGAVNDGVTPNTLAFSQLLDTDIAPAKIKTIKVPAGVYVIDAPIAKDLLYGAEERDLQIDGEGMDNTVLLWRGGADLMLTFTSIRNLYLNNITLSGFKAGDASVLQAGSTAIKCSGSVIADHVQIVGFDTLIERTGGYYHKFTSCLFMYFKVGFKNFTANNTTFENCKAQRFEKLVEVVGGTGPLTYIGGSIEQFTNSPFSASAGAKPSLLMIGTFVENAPDIIPPAGLTGVYNNAMFAVAFEHVTFLGNTIFANGIRRMIYSSNGNLRSVVSLGNNIMCGGAGASDLENYIHATATIETVEAHDIYSPIVQIGTYTPAYMNNTAFIINKDASRIYDPIQKKDITPNPAWIPLTLENGWTQNVGTGAAVAAYRKIGNRVQIKGFVIGTGATASTIATLPEGYRPSEYIRHCTFDAGTALIKLRLLTSGALLCDMTPYTSNNLVIDMEFELS
jgi:hypothetical protein